MFGNTMAIGRLVPWQVYAFELTHREEVVLSIIGALLIVLVLLGLCLIPIFRWRRNVRRRGYAGILEYLREIPETRAEQLDAVDLTMKGCVLCCLGLIFPPILVIGLVPLYYGARKLLAIKLGIPPAKDDSEYGHSE